MNIFGIPVWIVVMLVLWIFGVGLALLVEAIVWHGMRRRGFR